MLRHDLLLFYSISFAVLLANLVTGLLISTVAGSLRKAMMSR
jgi:hypothetical protein